MLTYAIQKAGYKHDQVDQRGATDYASFMAELEAFPWTEQQRQWEEKQDDSPPGFVLQDKPAERELWIQPLGEALQDDFQVHSVSMQLKKGVLGFGQAKLKQDWTSIEVGQRSRLDALCRLFCAGDYEALDREVAEIDRRET